MLSASIAPSSAPSADIETGSTPSATLKESFEHYRALGIKLHMLADQCPQGLEQQSSFDRQQADCIKGQAAVLQAAGRHDITSKECAKIMMALWTEEVLQGQEASDMSDTDRMALKVFEFFQKQLVSE